MGIRITTDDYGVRVWRTDKHGYANYAITIQKKQESGSYVNIYKQVRFRKGIEVENGDEIYIHEAFPTVETWKDRATGELHKKEVWMIMNFSYKSRREIPHQEKRPANRPPVQTSFDDIPDTFQASDDDIPF